MKNKPAIWWIAVITTAILCASIISGVIFYGVTTAVLSSTKSQQEKAAAIRFLATEVSLSDDGGRFACRIMMSSVRSDPKRASRERMPLRNGGSINQAELARLCKVAGYK